MFLRDPAVPRSHGIDIDTLFGNLEEVIRVSEDLYRHLEKSTISTEEQCVGRCFLMMADQLRRVYGAYCSNHEDVVPLWQKYESQPEAAAYLQKCLEKMSRETNCFDIPAVLIKPVQRILKYPLLLNELLKATEDDHRDKADLLEATNVMMDMANHINESKRRQDLIDKYCESI